MKRKYRLKSWVVVVIYVIGLGAIVGSLYSIGKTLKGIIFDDDNTSYVYKEVFLEDEEDALPVVNYSSSVFGKPFTDENVKVLKSFYDKDDSEDIQQSSLILYQNTYMPNTGILYSNSSSFNIVAALDGKVDSITADEIMGNIISISYSNNLSLIYQCLNEVNIAVGDSVKQGDVLGTSGINKIETSSENMLLFEVIYNGEYINPEKVYDMDLALFN